MTSEADAAHSQGLIDVRDEKGPFAAGNVLPSVRRDAGILHEAIEKHDQPTIRRILQKYRSDHDRAPSAERSKPSTQARREIALAALHALETALRDTQRPNEFLGLPEDLSRLAGEQMAQIVEYYCTLSVGELRRRRSELRVPLWLAWKRGDMTLLTNLQFRDSLLDLAIDRKTAKANHAARAEEPRDDQAATTIGGTILAFAAVAGFVALVRRHRRRT